MDTINRVKQLLNQQRFKMDRVNDAIRGPVKRRRRRRKKNGINTSRRSQDRE